MPTAVEPFSHPAQRWPCGPECRFAQPLRNTYGEWHWCSHPYAGGKVARDGRECSHYQSGPPSAASSAPPYRPR